MKKKHDRRACSCLRREHGGNDARAGGIGSAVTGACALKALRADGNGRRRGGTTAAGGYSRSNDCSRPGVCYRR